MCTFVKVFYKTNLYSFHISKLNTVKVRELLWYTSFKF
jgi:hypothetical protein